MPLRLIAWIAAGVLAALGTGWLLGASGRSGAREELRVVEQRASFAEARAGILAARVSIFQQNFGDGSRHLEAARAVVEKQQTSWREVGLAERAGRLEIVLAHIKDAQRLAAALDQGAHSAADAALQALKSAEQ